MEYTELIDVPIVPKNIDIVITGGGARGGVWGLGILKFIKELEEKKIIKVNSFSGSSVGSVLGAYYLNNTLDRFEEKTNNVEEIAIKKKNIKSTKSKLFEKTDFDLSKINNKLFIKCYKNNKEYVKSKFNDNKELNKYLFNTCFIPFFFEDSYSKNGYSDSMFPHFFLTPVSKKNDILYINLKSNSILKNNINFDNKKLQHSGIIQASKFFYLNESEYISYVSTWNFKTILILRIKETIILLIHIIYSFLQNNNIISLIPRFIRIFCKQIFVDYILFKAFS